MSQGASDATPLLFLRAARRQAYLAAINLHRRGTTMASAHDPTARVDSIRVYPIKSLDPADVPSATITAGGSLRHDRRFAVVGPDGRYVNGKRFPRVHLVRSAYRLDEEMVTVSLQGDRSESFSLRSDAGPLERWLSRALGVEVRIREDADLGFPDDTDAHGPTVVSTSSLREVASWFPGLTLEAVRRRFRANIEIGGVAPFWEDGLLSGDQSPHRFSIGDVRFEGVTPCARCVVPTRDPETADVYPDFMRTFIERRTSLLPTWAPRERFEHFYRLAVNTRVGSGEKGKGIAVGDPVRHDPT